MAFFDSNPLGYRKKDMAIPPWSTMNKRIRKKKQKQQEQIEQAIAGLLEVVEEAQRKHWQLWVEKSTKQFVAAVMRHYEQREEYSVWINVSRKKSQSENAKRA